MGMMFVGLLAMIILLCTFFAMGIMIEWNVALYKSFKKKKTKIVSIPVMMITGYAMYVLGISVFEIITAEAILETFK